MKKTFRTWLVLSAIVFGGVALPLAGCSPQEDKADHKVDGLEMDEPPLGGGAGEKPK